jgi:hypothetical protein
MAISVTKDVTPREVDWGNIAKYSERGVKDNNNDIIPSSN